uniref:GOLD domain-containing protein n=2 Tax=Caenorhabditis japonica TaxID=281687 RepID=A0A8R1EC27_CAEJA
KECLFFTIHQPHSQMDISVSTLNTEYPLSVELLQPTGISARKSENSGKHYFKFPEKDGLVHEIGDFQLCVSTISRQTVQVSLIIVIYEKNAKNIDVASNLNRIDSSATTSTFSNFEKITLSIDEKLQIMKTEQAKRAFVEKIVHAIRSLLP